MAHGGRWSRTIRCLEQHMRALRPLSSTRKPLISHSSKIPTVSSTASHGSLMHPHQAATILLVGSSIMELWSNAGEMLSPSKVINIGVSGSVTKDWLPARQGGEGLIDNRLMPLLSSDGGHGRNLSGGVNVVVFYCGSNDINDGLKAEEVKGNTLSIFESIWQADPNCRILYLEVMSAPQKRQDRLLPVVEELNGMMLEAVRREEADREGRDLIYVPVNDLLSRDEKGCYLDDQLHLTSEGYAFVAERIKVSLLQN